MDKSQQRKICLNGRNAMDPEERKRCSRIICEKLKAISEGKRILSYCPIGSETDISSFNDRHDVAYPVTAEDGEMEAYLPIGGHFILNEWRIREPDPSFSKKIDPKDLDLIIVPCVGFDEKRRRLGHGKGYYDRFLRRTDALRVGVAFEVQKLETVCTEEHDLPLDLIITEKNTY